MHYVAQSTEHLCISVQFEKRDFETDDFHCVLCSEKMKLWVCSVIGEVSVAQLACSERSLK